MDFYNDNCVQYYERTIGATLSEFYPMLEKNLHNKAKILDLGAGSGRDTVYFLGKGFEVVSVDGAAKLADYASKKLGISIHVMRFAEISFKDEFDGVWASCSLLHLSDAELNDVYKKVHSALNAKGYFYASFKLGTGSGLDAEGRFFNYQNENSLLRLAEENSFISLDIRIEPVEIAGRKTTFLHWLGKKK